MGQDILKYFWDNASVVCRICTVISLVLFLVFICFDFQERKVNERTENEIKKMADYFFDPIMDEISEMDEAEQKNAEPLIRFVEDVKPIWISMSVSIATMIIGSVFDWYRLPFDKIKDVLQKKVFEIKDDEAWMWVPFVVLCGMDIISLII